MNWKISLDKYLTSSPDDGFDSWVEEIISNRITDEFFEKNEKWVIEFNGQCNKWLNMLFDKYKSPIEAALIIERAFKIYCKNLS